MKPTEPSPVLKDRGILITGGSLGIGKAVARACVAAGANVLIAARHADTLEKAQAELRAEATLAQRVLALATDVSDPAAAAGLVTAAHEQLPDFVGLVNCAAVTGPVGLLEDIDPEEWSATIQVNLMGTVLVCRAALPHFRARGYGKIVNFSGGGATSPRPRFSAYASSKAAVVGFTETLAREVEGSGICVNAVAPGAVNTRMLEDVLAAGPERAGAAAYQAALAQKESGGALPERAAALCVGLLSAESDGLSGRLISAVWDPWDSLVKNKDRIRETDLYTLRRITPRDRGLEEA